jgi:hypothetical protein
MKPLALSFALLLALTSCQRGPQSGIASLPGHGAISVQVIPNPIVAKQVSGSTYDFTFDVNVKETGGRPVNIQRVSVTVFGPGGFTLGRDSWDSAQIRAMGYSPSVGAFAESRLRFNPRKEVPDERLFNGVSAELKVEATDDTGAETSATTAVTVTR